MADAGDSKSPVLTGMRVRLPPPAPDEAHPEARGLGVRSPVRRDGSSVKTDDLAEKLPPWLPAGGSLGDRRRGSSVCDPAYAERGNGCFCSPLGSSQGSPSSARSRTASARSFCRGSTSAPGWSPSPFDVASAWAASQRSSWRSRCSMACAERFCWSSRFRSPPGWRSFAEGRSPPGSCAAPARSGRARGRFWWFSPSSSSRCRHSTRRRRATRRCTTSRRPSSTSIEMRSPTRPTCG